MSLKHLVKIVVVLVIWSLAAIAQDGPANPAWPGPGQLFVGACYQPVDRSPEQIDIDIAIMKRAGFNVVHMGDLSWDSFEPSQGKFTFEWFDRIMDKMQASGIMVIVDIPGSYAQQVRPGQRALPGDRVEGVGDGASPEFHLQDRRPATRSENPRGSIRANC